MLGTYTCSMSFLAAYSSYFLLTHLGGNRLLRGRCILILHPTSIHLQNNSLTFSFSFENKTCAKERFLNQVEERCKRPFGVQMSPRIAVTK
jgi:hypothetical protein